MRTRNIVRTVLASAALLALTACAQTQAPSYDLAALETPIPHPGITAIPSQPAIPGLNRHSGIYEKTALINYTKRLNCVQFARMWSGINVRGNAKNWWANARGKYTRSHQPTPGAVMVFSGTRFMHMGHVAVVRYVVSPREIRVDHANWSNHGRMHLNVKVVDISKQNDWSRVHVWYTPGKVMGSRTYPVKGFILPHAPDAGNAPAS